MDPQLWSKVMLYGYALWFVAALGLLGFFTGWQVDRYTMHPEPVGRVMFALVGALGGAYLGWRFALRPPAKP